MTLSSRVRRRQAHGSHLAASSRRHDVNVAALPRRAREFSRLRDAASEVDMPPFAAMTRRAHTSDTARRHAHASTANSLSSSGAGCRLSRRRAAPDDFSPTAFSSAVLRIKQSMYAHGQAASKVDSRCLSASRGRAARMTSRSASRHARRTARSSAAAMSSGTTLPRPGPELPFDRWSIDIAYTCAGG